MTIHAEDMKRKYAQLLENSYERIIEWIDAELEYIYHDTYVFEDSTPQHAIYFQVMSKDSEKVIEHYTKEGYTCQALPAPDSQCGDIMKANEQSGIMISW